MSAPPRSRCPRPGDLGVRIEARSAIKKARGELSASLDDEEYRKRLQNKFGDRWTVKRLVEARGRGQEAGTVDAEEADVLEPPEAKGRSKRKRRKTRKRLTRRATAGGHGQVAEADAPVDVPQIRFGRASEFDQPWHLALWAPNSPGGPAVVINQDSPILEEVVRYHQDRYPAVHDEEVRKIILQVFGEVAACKVAHSQKLAEHVAEEELDGTYRTEAALTTGLMGLIAEESLIGQRLGKLGRRRPRRCPLGCHGDRLGRPGDGCGQTKRPANRATDAAFHGWRAPRGAGGRYISE